MEVLFDSHAHLDDEQFDIDRDDLINGIKEAGVGFVVDPGCNIPSSLKSIDISKKYDIVYSAVGCHPEDAKYFKDEDLQVYEKMLENEKVVAIGEIGLDYYWEDNAPREVQKDVFRKQIELSIKHKLPIIIHARDSIGDIYDLLEEYKGKAFGIMHCYSASSEMAERFLKLGYYISLAGPVTFKNSKHPKEVAKIVPIDKLLIETDSPYLAPVPMRGKRNQPSYTRYVAEEIAKLRETDLDTIIRATRENAMRLFGICK